MKAEDLKVYAIGLGVAAAAYLAWRAYNTGAAGLASGAVGVVDDAVGGLIQGVGAVFGVPKTDPTKCAQAKASGSIMDSLTYCPAGEALSYNVGNAVQSIGTVVGVPRTNMTECERAKAEGRTWDASFACPASDWLKYVFT